ncbi:MAG: dienelactone hydrolase family protein [Dehalococcoidia bacterium]|nr:dienelactone hydrolase family protein [Dehalococcoidia bacterium]
MAGQIVTFASNGGQAEGYLATPPSNKGPGVIVIQEWWGLNDNIKDISNRFAAEGYVALAPDLYHGENTTEPDEAGKMMMAMKMDEAAKDLAGAVDYLKSHDAVGPRKVGSVGFCLGGGLSLFLASIEPVDACVIYYGVLPGAQEDLDNVKCPVLGHYAEHDEFASPDMARELEKELRAKGVQVEFHVYDGTNHAFFNDTRADAHAPEAAKVSWERTLAFFGQHLKR